MAGKTLRPQATQERTLRESPLVYPLWKFPPGFPASTYTSAYSRIADWIDPELGAAQVADRGQGSGEKVTFESFDYGDAEAPSEVTVDVWRKIVLHTWDLKLQSTTESNAATGEAWAVADEEDLDFTTHTLLPAEGFHVRSLRFNLGSRRERISCGIGFGRRGSYRWRGKSAR